MFPTWFLQTVLVAVALALLVLGWRLFRRFAVGAATESPADLSSGQPGHAGASPPTTWGNVALFQSTADPDQLPGLRSEDIPLYGNDDYVFGSLTPALAEAVPDVSSRDQATRQDLLSAGYYQPHAFQNLKATRYVAVMLALSLAAGLLVIAPARWEFYALVSVIALPLLAWALPGLLVRNRAAERRSEIERAMPDLLDMLYMCVSQGLTVPDALNRIVHDLRGVYPALAQELRIVQQQAWVGNLPLALENFNRRVDSPEVHSFTTLMTQTERMGTSVSQSLASYSDNMRESFKQRADEKGNRAAFRLLFPTVLCLMPAVYMFLLGPAVIELADFFGRGGRDSLDRSGEVIQELNEQRTRLMDRTGN